MQLFAPKLPLLDKFSWEGGETISIQYLKALRGEIVWDMSSILSVDHHRCAMQGMSMGQVLNVQNVIV